MLFAIVSVYSVASVPDPPALPHPAPGDPSLPASAADERRMWDDGERIERGCARDESSRPDEVPRQRQSFAARY